MKVYSNIVVSLLCLVGFPHRIGERFTEKLIKTQNKVHFLAVCSEWGKSGG